MTKHLSITVSLPLHADVIPQAKQIVASEKLLEAINAAITEHLPGATVTHAITAPEPEKAPRKQRQALGVGLPAPEALLIRGHAETAEKVAPPAEKPVKAKAA